MIFSDTVLHTATALLHRCRAANLKLVTAESLTAGLISAAFTSLPGASDVFDRAFVTYSYSAKTQLLGVSHTLLLHSGAVCEPVARAMALGALTHSHPYGSLSIAVTGVAGPDPADGHPPGRVHLAAARADLPEIIHLQRDYGPIGRDAVRLATVSDALTLALTLASEPFA